MASQSSLRELVKTVSNKKMGEAVPVVQQYAKSNLNPGALQTRFFKWRDEFKPKYIDTGSVKPLFSTMWGVFFISYAMSWPREYAHMKAEEQAKLEGRAAH